MIPSSKSLSVTSAFGCFFGFGSPAHFEFFDFARFAFGASSSASPSLFGRFEPRPLVFERFDDPLDDPI